MKEKIYEAALALANRCDGAVERDNQGFNATHSATGKYLASLPMNVLSDDELAFLADHILPTYYKQLEALGFDKKDLKYNHTSKHMSVQGFNDHLRWIKKQIEERDKYRIGWSDEANRLYIVSPFDRNLLNEYREIKPRGVFNKTLGLKEWAYKIEAAKDIQAFIERHPNFVVSDEAKEKIAEGLTIEVTPVEEYRIKETEDYFLVFFPYDEEMIQRVRAIQGSSFAYYEDDKHWKIPKNDISLADFRGFVHHYEIFHDHLGRIDNILYELRGVKEEREALSKAINASVELDDSKLKMTLRPYQRIGTRFMLDNKCCFNADSMGLGKSAETLAFLGCCKDSLPALIVVPASLKLNWAKEALSWLDVSVTVIDKKDEHRVRLINGQTVTVQSNQWDADIVIINYDLLVKYEDELRDMRYRTMIIDESHYIKGAGAKRTKQATALSKKAKYRFALSGTPVLNKVAELIPQLEFLGRLEDVGGKQNFLRRYCQPTHNGYGWDYNGSSNLEELHKILRQEGIYIRRTKEQVLTELPPKQRITVPLELSGKWQRKYKEAEDDLINYIERQARLHKDFLKSIEHLSETEQKARISAWRKEKAQRAAKAEHLVKIQTTKYICAKGKLDSFKEWADDFLATGEKLIVFAHHTDIIEELTEHFKEYNAVYITGSVSTTKRQEHVDRFQNDKDCRVIVCNLQAGGVGITLTAASNVATLEFAWTAGLHDQVEDRSNRIGQVNAVNCWYFTGVDTIDDYLIGIVEGKRTVTDALIDGTTDTPKEGVIGDLSKWMLIKDNKTKNALAEYSEDMLSALFEQE